MKLLKRGMSIRWKLMLMYFMLVFIATTIIGSFILRQTETYYTNSMRENMINVVIGGTLMSTLEGYDDLDLHREEIQVNIEAWVRSLQMDVFVVDRALSIIASNTANVDKNALDVLDRAILIEAFSGERAESRQELYARGEEIPVMNIAFPINSEAGDTQGVLYVRSDMSLTRDSIAKSRTLFIEAMLIALAVTMLLGYIIAGSITVPVTELTKTSERMAEGDFSMEIESRSDDEIGSLAEMLDLLRKELNSTISQISGERAKLEAIISAMADGLIAAELSGKVIHANPAAARLMHFSSAELETMSFDEAMNYFLPGELSFSEIMEKTKDGPAAESFTNAGFTYAFRYTRFKDDAGEDAGIILIMQDITERRKIEDMQTDFVANVSHELKTPLTTIKTYTETLLDGAVSDEETARSFLGIVDEEADRMNRIVKDLLQLSRLDFSDRFLNRKETNLIPLMQSAVRKVELSAKQKGQHMNSLFNAGEELRAVVDRDAIEQALLNILSNAIKYTGEGGRIDVDAYASGKSVQLSVSDTGIGIPEKDISRVFERFFRVDKARSRAMGGTGLGLAITKRIVEEHGGEIGIESREGRGTRVTIKLPLAVARGIKGIE